ncbi:hypothetical protein Mmc1_3055 [Magnetococcus marinus MC-1]|uniref:Nucleotide modification associated domain-containing protein n=1 Tax=Magnetococcus marinus (strain ATCC BAA-1437 / JCM 17883 / MC-1) TaxID=156889 RepID=A0LC53_MAGMM|nr:hypothetical protein [Magnetococcus marinus]ABK45546.1 hypothetical protein Mmc1_3055 [Magnetococcus marinus MC-1]
MKKIVFSRKGFDSSAGGFPSIIFPDGSLFSIPIPSNRDKYTYSDLEYSYEGDEIQKILADITNGMYCKHSVEELSQSSYPQYCHHDPYFFREESYSGLTLGQVGSAEGHLRNQGISEDDIFLFYGWFKQIKKNGDLWSFDSTAKDLHLVWSQITVGKVIQLDSQQDQEAALQEHPFLINHPHVGKQDGGKNRIYLSKSSELFDFHTQRCLTDTEKYKGRSTWRLPRYFNQPEAFSYLNNFSIDGHDVIISYQGYGQEFVLNLDKVKTNEEREHIKKHISLML